MQAAAAGAVYLALVLWSMSAVLEEPDTYLLGPPLNVASKIARTDQQMVLATVIRHARILVTDPRELRGYGQCYPLDKSYTLGEHMFGNGLLAAIPFLVSGDPLIAYNFMLGATLWIPAMAMYALAWAFTRSSTAAFVAGLFVCLTHARIVDPVHPYLQGDIWTPLALLFLYRLFERRDWWSAAGLGLFFSLGVLESLYALLSSTILLGVCGLFLLVRHRNSLLPVLPKLAAAGAWVGLVSWFVLEPYLETSATWDVLKDQKIVIMTPPEAFLPGRALFPGVALLVLVVVALADRLRSARSALGADPRLALLTAAVLIVWSSLDSPKLMGVFQLESPILLIRSFVPGLDAVRVPGKVVLCLYLALSLLAAYGFQVLVRRAGPAISVGAAAVVMLLVVGGHWYPPSAALGQGSSWLPEAVHFRLPEDRVELLERIEGGAVIDLPAEPENLFVRAYYLMHSAYHGRPVATCYNSFGSEVPRRVHEVSEALPSAGAVNALAALGFDTVLLHWNRFTPERRLAFRSRLRSALRTNGQLELIGRAKGLSAYRLDGRGPIEDSFDMLTPFAYPKAQNAETPESAISFRVRNRSSATYRHPDPIEPSDLLIRWDDPAGEEVARATLRSVLPLAIDGEASQSWEVVLPVPVPPGRYRVSVALADDPERWIAERQVKVTAPRKARR